MRGSARASYRARRRGASMGARSTSSTCFWHLVGEPPLPLSLIPFPCRTKYPLANIHFSENGRSFS